ncbi:MAG: hypothetical protein EOO07_25980 [Chitinophagaceae bacterium]|nr:MAG: hypothetical protein EOO07_25980 [Chitinophagaceae bacterium]
MKKQDYSHHTKVYTPHHLVFYPLIIFLLSISIRYAITDAANTAVWVMLALCFAMITFLAFMTRQHYALTLQNRLVRLEMRLRYFQLTGKRLEKVEDKLGFGRIAALRFASDEELPGLLDKALSENMSSDEIKKSINNWTADHMRV